MFRRFNYRRYRALINALPSPYREQAHRLLDQAPSPEAEPLIAILSGQRPDFVLSENVVMLARLYVLVQAGMGNFNPVVRVSPPDEGQRAYGEAEGLFREYELTKNIALLESASKAFAEVRKNSSSVEVRASSLYGMGLCKWSQFEEFRRFCDIDSAIDMLRRALDEVHASHPLSLAFRGSLGGALLTRWGARTSPSDLAEAIAQLKMVVKETPADHPALTIRLNSLGLALSSFALASSDSSALDEAIMVLRDAVGPLRQRVHGAQANLAELLRRRHELSLDGDAAALDEALTLIREELAQTPRTDPLWPRFQSLSGLTMYTRYESNQLPEDLEAAHQAILSALEATPAEHPNLAERLSLLEKTQLARFERRWGISGLPLTPSAVRPPVAARVELDEIVETAELAARAAPAGHVLDLHSRLALAHAHALRHLAYNIPADLRAASALWDEIAVDPASGPSSRAQAARNLAFIQLADPREESARLTSGQLFRLAVNQLPLLTTRGIPRADRERSVAMFNELARDAAAHELRLGGRDPALALTLLEQGRGVLHGRILSDRAESARLRELLPDLADRFDQLLHELNLAENKYPGMGPAGSTGAAGIPPTADTRRDLALQLDVLIKQIRQINGFENFLNLPSINELLPTAGGTPAVVVNVSVLGCDALIVEDGRVRAITLSSVTAADTVEQATAFLSAVWSSGNENLPLSARKKAQEEVTEILGWLWTAVAEPVLEELRLSPKDGTAQTLPRLWWIPTGPLSHLPLHAAASPGEPGHRVLDRVISSYAPTLRQLARPTAPPVHPEDDRLLVVAMPQTPGARDLPHVNAEVAALAARFPHARVLSGETATRAALLRELSGHTRVHFACHAVSAVDPSATARVLLHDHQENPVTTADLATLRLDGRELAYLSACETVRSRPELIEEALHIAGALYITGYRHVIGTLWRLNDEVAAQTAEIFYEELAKTRDPALALHFTVQALRSDFPSTPTLWAAHIHIGA